MLKHDHTPHSRHRHMRGEFSPSGSREHGHHRGRRRIFDHGELRLVILSLVAERPRHGYELIKAIEERLGGAYAPSPGAVYPTLTMLEELGHVSVSPIEGGRKQHSVTEDGLAWLAAHDAEAKAAMARMAEMAGDAVNNPPAPILRAMENVKTALRLRLGGAPIAAEQADTIAGALDAVAAQIGRG